MKISIELTSEQVEWAKRHAQQCQFATPSSHHHAGVGDVEEWDAFDNLVDALASIVVGLANG